MFRRGQMVVLHGSGIGEPEIAAFAGCALSTVYRWTARAKDGDVSDRMRPGRTAILDDAVQLRLIAFYCQSHPLPGCGHWTIRWAAKYLRAHPKHIGVSISSASIHRILQRHHLKPHQSKYFLHISDPDFFPKMEHLIQLYANPPEHLWFFDECPGIQILTRIAPDMSTEAKQWWLKEFEYNRNGTLDVMAFLQAKTGTVFARCTFDHKSATFLQLFEQHVRQQPDDARLDYVMDNLSSHSNAAFVQLVARLSGVESPKLGTVQKRRDWLQSANKRIVVHFTPFHGSWLNWVENWFGILNQKCLRSSFASCEALIAAIDAFVDIWNTLLAHPFTWTYGGAGLHEKVVLRFIKLLSGELQPLPIKFLTKQLLVMTNLAKSYSDKIKVVIWTRCRELLQSKAPFLRKIIAADDKPRRRTAARAALRGLLAALSDLLETEHVKVA